MVQVVERVGALLSAFTEERPELSLGECAERAGLSKSSAHRLLTAMGEIGLVEQIEGARWRIGGLVVRLAAISLSHVDMRAEVTAALRALGQRYQAATAFSVPNGSEMVYVERAESPIPYAPAAKLGSTAPMWGGAAGRAVLAALHPEERAQRLADPAYAALPEDVRTSVERDIADAVATGYSVDWGRTFDEVGGVAVALGRRYEPLAAISLILSPDRLTAELVGEIGQQMRAVADQAVAVSTLPSGERQFA